jgi:dihydrofolate synthase/folylpolyglutamate synthase
MGKYQFDNACLAATSLQFLPNFIVSDNNIKQGIEQTTWFGRNEIIQKKPLIIFDVGHNEAGIRGFLDYFRSINNSETSILVVSLQRQKNIMNVVPKLLDTFDYIICCETNNLRTMTLDEMKTQLGKTKKVSYIKSAEDAINKGISLLQFNTDKMAIVGTHHFGTPISTIFNKSFNTL